MKELRYITTPIYYVNDIAHIGHTYTSIIADILARFYRLKGHDTLFLTGTDEHGQKIEQAATLKGYDPRKYADIISADFKDLWDSIGISYDIYARTTDQRHIECVKEIFQKIYNNGDIYKGHYEGQYCISCETFFTKTQLKAELYCPDCGKQVHLVKEESYFFALSKYQDKILQWYEKADPIIPNNKKSELINFVKSGLKDLSITRTSFNWGIKLPKSLNDEKHIIYVWLDALFIYLSSLDYVNDGANTRFFPAYMHLVGKDILKFHAIYWPAFLMSAGLELPKYIASHGWWTINGEKMSKSKGNVINPRKLIKIYGIDPIRYFLLKEVPFGNDGDFNEKALISRINNELCNELGNLLNRIIGMSNKYCELKIKSDQITKYFKDELKENKDYLDQALIYLEKVQTSKYLEELFKSLALANNIISKYEPWKLIKNDESKAKALIALSTNILAKVSILLSPVMPDTCKKISKALNYEINTQNYEYLINENNNIDFVITPCEILFKKIEDDIVLKDAF